MIKDNMMEEGTPVIERFGQHEKGTQSVNPLTAYSIHLLRQWKEMTIPDKLLMLYAPSFIWTTATAD